jgi:hypothetical protein
MTLEAIPPVVWVALSGLLSVMTLWVVVRRRLDRHRRDRGTVSEYWISQHRARSRDHL